MCSLIGLDFNYGRKIPTKSSRISIKLVVQHTILLTLFFVAGWLSCFLIYG